MIQSNILEQVQGFNIGNGFIEQFRNQQQKQNYMRNSSAVEGFQIIRHLGKGSYSTVDLVKSQNNSGYYAMKQISMDKLTQQDKQSALNQIRILASISSPYIISYEGSFYSKKSNSLCILMQYAEEGDLQSVINECAKKHKMKKGLSEKLIWSTLIDILMGLEILHENKIVHRDIKSANIFYSKGIAKIGDFNVSKISDNQMYQTKTGTPYYTAPEIWKGQIYDMSCDIWSLGCIIYQMCALLPPFRSNNFPALFISITKGNYDALPLSYSEDLRIIVQMCLQVDPDDRLSAKELLNHPLLIKNMGQRKYKRKDTLIDMIGPLKCPKIMKFMNSSLPKPLKSRKQITFFEENLQSGTNTKKKIDFSGIGLQTQESSPIGSRKGVSIRIKKTTSKHLTPLPIKSQTSIKIERRQTPIKSTKQLKDISQKNIREASKAKTVGSSNNFRLKSIVKSKKHIEKQNLLI